MNVTVWGARGSVPSPGPETVRYGGNTSCVGITLADGTLVVLDAGTGIRNLGLALESMPRSDPSPAHPPPPRPHSGSPLLRTAVRSRCARDDLGADGSRRVARGSDRALPVGAAHPRRGSRAAGEVDFRLAPPTEWEIGSATARAESVSHRGPTLGFTITEDGRSLCYIPDHEPAIAGPVEDLETEWLSGYRLARGVDLLLHDCQYTDDEYARHAGWGHSSLSDALAFAHRTEVRRTLLFHHDPLHTDDQLDELAALAGDRWQELSRNGAQVGMASERLELTLTAR